MAVAAAAAAAEAAATPRRAGPERSELGMEPHLYPGFGASDHADLFAGATWARQTGAESRRTT